MAVCKKKRKQGDCHLHFKQDDIANIKQTPPYLPTCQLRIYIKLADCSGSEKNGMREADKLYHLERNDANSWTLYQVSPTGEYTNPRTLKAKYEAE